MRTDSCSIDRRTFLKAAPASVAAAAAAGLTSRAVDAQQSSTNPSAYSGVETEGPVYRTLGRTGMKVAVVGMGSNRAPDPALFRYAFDRGVNYFDTARSYKNGLSERNLGQAIKGVRDKVHITTKIHTGSKEEMRRLIEESIRALQVDHTDVLLAHGLKSKEEVMDGDIREVLAEARKQGKTRFVGFSTHSNVAACIDAAVADPDKFFDVITAQFNFKNDASVNEATARAAKAGIGMVAMKTQVKARNRGGGSGGYDTKEFGDISPHQAALKWVFNNASISTAIPSMLNIDEIKEDTEVMGMMKLSTVDKQILSRYDAYITPYYCSGCGACKTTCPKGVNIAEVNRCLMYAEGYGDLDMARSAYSELPPESTAAACTDCPECVAECVRGLRIARNMRVAQTILA